MYTYYLYIYIHMQSDLGLFHATTPVSNSSRVTPIDLRLESLSVISFASVQML